MPKQITYVVDGIESDDFDEVSCWPKQWFPDDRDFDVTADPFEGRSDRHRIVVTAYDDLPVPDSAVYDEVEIEVRFFKDGSLVTSLSDTVRPPGPQHDDEEACDPGCVE